jgi:hypothetical protein
MHLRLVSAASQSIQALRSARAGEGSNRFGRQFHKQTAVCKPIQKYKQRELARADMSRFSVLFSHLVEEWLLQHVSHNAM